MKISSYTRYGHRILNVEDRIGLTSSIIELRNEIHAAFQQGHIHLALSFPSDSFFSSRFLALLIESAEKATSCGGSLTVIAPNTQIIEILAIFNLEWTLRTVANEKELLAVSSRTMS